MKWRYGIRAVFLLIGSVFLMSVFSCQDTSYEPEKRSFLLHFEGRLGKKERLSADISCLGLDLAGFISRGQGAKPMPVRGNIEGTTFTLSGTDPRDEAGTYRGSLSEDGASIKGEWSKADGSGKTAFSLAAERKKALVFNSLMLREAGTDGSFIGLGLAEPATASKDFLKRFRAEYFGGAAMQAYGAAQMEALRQRRGGQAVYKRYFVPYRNYGGILSLWEAEEVRGSEGTTTVQKRLRSFDYAKNRALVLDDVIKPGSSEALNAALNATLRLTYSLGPEASLLNLGFRAESLRATDSFGLAEGGILFFFPSGSVADKSLGDISVYLAADLVGDMVRPGFFKR